MENEYLTIKEACRILKISRPTLYNEINAGKLRIIKIGRCTRILGNDLIKAFGGAEKK